MTYGQDLLRRTLYDMHRDHEANIQLREEAQAISETLATDPGFFVATWSDYSSDDFVSLWRATCLSVGVNPDHKAVRSENIAKKVVELGSVAGHDFEALKEVIRRYENVQLNADIADSGLKLNRHKKIELSEFMTWAAKKKWAVPAGCAGAPVHHPSTHQPHLTTHSPEPVVTAGASGGVEPDKAGPVALAALPKQRAQERRILELLASQGYNPLELPPRMPGKTGTKAKIKALALLDTALFSDKSFDTAWQRLRGQGDVMEGEGVSP